MTHSQATKSIPTCLQEYSKSLIGNKKKWRLGSESNSTINCLILRNNLGDMAADTPNNYPALFSALKFIGTI